MCRRHELFRLGVVAGGLLFSVASIVARAQDPLENAPIAPQAAAKSDEGATGTSDAATSPGDAKAAPKAKPEFIRKTAAEWRGLLTKVQYAVTREKATEPPYTGKYASGHFRGMFVCVCCDAAHVQSELFSSQTKFESGTGWPSFYQAVNNKAIQTAIDYSGLEPRIEVMCRRCGAHLGHVFDDGPPPTGLRFCLNSAAIKLVSPDGLAGTKHSASKPASKPKMKAKSKAGAKSAPSASPPHDPAGPTDSDRVAPAGETKGASSAPSR